MRISVLVFCLSAHIFCSPFLVLFFTLKHQFVVGVLLGLSVSMCYATVVLKALFSKLSFYFTLDFKKELKWPWGSLLFVCTACFVHWLLYFYWKCTCVMRVVFEVVWFSFMKHKHNIIHWWATESRSSVGYIHVYINISYVLSRDNVEYFSEDSLYLMLHGWWSKGLSG